MDYNKINKIEINEVLNLINLYKNDEIIDLKIKNKLYSRCKSIVDHDDWYSVEDINIIYKNASQFKFFSNKQKKSLSYSSMIKNKDEEYDYDDGANSDEDRRWCD